MNREQDSFSQESIRKQGKINVMPRKKKGSSPKKTGNSPATHPLGFQYMSEERPLTVSRFSDILPGLVARYGLGRKLGVEKYQRTWEQILSKLTAANRQYPPGEKLRELSRPIAFRNGTVRIEVEGNILFQELGFQRTWILSEFQRALPEEKIKQIRFTLK